ncbi:MAG: nitrite reductase small subunit NirD [Spirulina sp. SIO3F2]|nr:nitrite reductase small subunit NirD [Spirulina sp. SIO3F2]
MVQAVSTPQQTAVQDWVDVCALADIFPNTGVCALVQDKQVAIYRVQIDDQDQVYALDNFDPFSQANVLSRGILGDRQGVLKVASPIYKQNFSLETGQCLDNDEVSVPTYAIQVVEGRVQVSIA